MYWDYHDKQIKALNKTYNRMNNQIQNRLQEVFNSFDYSEPYKIASKKDKEKVNSYIEEWIDEGLFDEKLSRTHNEVDNIPKNNQLRTLALNIKNRTRVTYSEILELMILASYVENEEKINSKEEETFKDVASFYYNQGRKEVTGKEYKSVIPEAVFFYLMTQPTSTGMNWKQTKELLSKNNADEMYKQALISISQQNELTIDSDSFQRVLNKQNKSRLNINKDKISGVVDSTLIGIDNKAKIEGITAEDNNAQVKFIAVEDENTTKMCDSLNGQIFNVKGKNKFTRFYGETPKELMPKQITCDGLVLGINLPPIEHHFHWCRSTIEYLRNNIEKSI